MRLCKCGKESEWDDLCQECWEEYCDSEWWRLGVWWNGLPYQIAREESDMNAERLVELMEEYIGYPPHSPKPEWIDYALAAQAIIDELRQEQWDSSLR